MRKWYVSFDWAFGEYVPKFYRSVNEQGLTYREAQDRCDYLNANIGA